MDGWQALQLLVNPAQLKRTHQDEAGDSRFLKIARLSSKSVEYRRGYAQEFSTNDVQKLTSYIQDSIQDLKILTQGYVG